MYNGNWTGWSAIWSEIKCLISKSNQCTVWNWFEIKYDFRPKLHDMEFNYYFITTILKSLRYRSFSLYKCFVDLVLSWFVESCKSCFSCKLIGFFKQTIGGLRARTIPWFFGHFWKCPHAKIHLLLNTFKNGRKIKGSFLLWALQLVVL